MRGREEEVISSVLRISRGSSSRKLGNRYAQGKKTKTAHVYRRLMPTNVGKEDQPDLQQMTGGKEKS